MTQTQKLKLFFLFVLDPEQRGGHQGHHQEEPGQVTEPPRQGDQNT